MQDTQIVKMRRWVALIALAALLVGLLAACSQAAAPAPSAPAAKQEAPKAAPTQAPAAPTQALAAKATEAPKVAATTAPTAAPAAKATEAPKTTGAAGTPKKGGKIVMAVAQEPGQLNRFYNAQGGGWVAVLAQEPFIDFDINGDPKPILAAEIPTVANGAISKDFLTIRYKLKPNLKWSSGQPVTSADLAFTFEAYQKSKVAPNPNQAFAGMDSVKVIDDLTVEAKYKEVNVSYLDAFQWILPKHKFTSPEVDKDHPELRLPTGTGPFIFKDWKAGNEIIAERNPNYRDPNKPYLDGITIRITPDRNAMLAALADGQLDWVHFVTASDMVTLDKNAKEGKIKFDTNPGPTQIEALWLNQSDNGDITKPHPVLGDKAVREALTLAINRKAIIDTILGGFAVQVSSMVPAGWAKLDRPMPAYDAKKANDILDAAGWKKGADGIREKGGVRASLRYSTPTGDRTRELYQQLIQQNAKDVGIELKIENKPNTNLFGSYQEGGIKQRGQYDIIMSRVCGGTDPSGCLFLFTTEAIPTEKNPVGNPFSHWTNKTFDELVKKGNSTLDQAERKKFYNQATALHADEFISIPLYANIRGAAYSKRLQGVTIGWWRLETASLQDAQDWWVQ